MQTRIDDSRLLVYRAAQAKQNHEPFSHLTAMSKLYVAEAATNVTHRCLHLAGFNGYSRNYPFEHLMRDAKITKIYEETSKVQKMVISSYICIK